MLFGQANQSPLRFQPLSMTTQSSPTMTRSSKKPRYDNKILEEAFAWVRDDPKDSSWKAAGKFSLSLGLLRSRVAGSNSHRETAVQRQEALFMAEEQALCNWIIQLGNEGNVIEPKDITVAVLSIIKARSPEEESADVSLGRHWTVCFLKRHPTLVVGW